jgi:hypothetical protein
LILLHRFRPVRTLFLGGFVALCCLKEKRRKRGVGATCMGRLLLPPLHVRTHALLVISFYLHCCAPFHVPRHLPDWFGLGCMPCLWLLLLLPFVLIFYSGSCRHCWCILLVLLCVPYAPSSVAVALPCGYDYAEHYWCMYRCCSIDCLLILDGCGGTGG